MKQRKRKRKINKDENKGSFADGDGNFCLRSFYIFSIYSIIARHYSMKTLIDAYFKPFFGISNSTK